jgi:hypothetical protein
VAYNPGVRCICVSIDGDKMNPNGEISGGELAIDFIYIKTDLQSNPLEHFVPV